MSTIKIIKTLTILANKLDTVGDQKSADLVDHAINKLAAEELEIPTFKVLDEKFRKVFFTSIVPRLLTLPNAQVSGTEQFTIFGEIPESKEPDAPVVMWKFWAEEKPYGVKFVAKIRRVQESGGKQYVEPLFSFESFDVHKAVDNLKYFMEHGKVMPEKKEEISEEGLKKLIEQLKAEQEELKKQKRLQEYDALAEQIRSFEKEIKDIQKLEKMKELTPEQSDRRMGNLVGLMTDVRNELASAKLKSVPYAPPQTLGDLPAKEDKELAQKLKRKEKIKEKLREQMRKRQLLPFKSKWVGLSKEDLRKQIQDREEEILKKQIEQLLKEKKEMSVPGEKQETIEEMLMREKERLLKERESFQPIEIEEEEIDLT